MATKDLSVGNGAEHFSFPNERFAGRSRAHELLETAIFTLCALQNSIGKNANGKNSFEMRNRTHGTRSGPDPLSKSPVQRTSSCSEKKYSQDQLENRVSVPVAELIGATVDVIECGIKCLRMFTDKEVPVNISSKGMLSWETLYSNCKSHSSPAMLANKETLNVYSEASRRIISFTTFLSKTLCGALPPRLVLVAAQLLQRYNDPLQASLLIHSCISTFLDFVASTHLKTSNPLCLSKEGNGAGNESSSVAMTICQVIQEASYDVVQPTSSIHLRNAFPYSELNALFMLDSECVAELNGTHKTFLRSTFEVERNEASESAERWTRYRKELECIFSAEVLHRLLELEGKCIARKQYSEKWQIKRANPKEYSSDEMCILNKIPNKAVIIGNPKATSLKNESEIISGQRKNTSLSNTSNGCEQTEKHSALSWLLTAPFKGTLIFFVKQSVLPVLLLTIVAILLRLFPTSARLLGKSLFHRSLAHQRRPFRLV